jgi:hypothetical protein
MKESERKKKQQQKNNVGMKMKFYYELRIKPYTNSNAIFTVSIIRSEINRMENEKKMKEISEIFLRCCGVRLVLCICGD